MQSSIAPRKLDSILQAIFSTSHYKVDYAFQTPTNWANVYKVTLDKGALYQPWDRTYIVRILNISTPLEDRQKEIQLTQQMAELGIGPKVFYGNAQAGVIVMDYIQTEKQGNVISQALLKSLAHKLKKLHGTNPAPYLYMGTGKLDSLFERVTIATEPQPNFQNPSRQKPSRFLIFAQALDLYTKLKEMLERDMPNRMVLCHLDLNKTNILWGKDQPWIIDWDVADQGDAYFDLATIINTLSLASEQESYFLQAYFEKNLTETQAARLYIQKQICFLRYAITTFGLCKSYNALPAPKYLPHKLYSPFVFPYEVGGADTPEISKNMALYILAMGFFAKAKAQISSLKFTQALHTINPNFLKEPIHESITAFRHH